MAYDRTFLLEGAATMADDWHDAVAEGSRERHYHDGDPHAGLPVFDTIHRIRPLIIDLLDDPYTIEQMQEVRMNTVIVRPLVNRLYDPRNVCLVYCLLVNRMQFLHERSSGIHLQTMSTARAALCELVACRILRRLDDDHPGSDGIVMLANSLVAGFDPFQNAPRKVLRTTRGNLPAYKQRSYDRKLTALEVAIISDSKLFLSSSSCQKVIDAVYHGKITYTPLSSVDILPDRYKHLPISLYNPRKAPRLNHYRLIVPQLRGMIEVCQFIVLLVLYVLTMVCREGLEVTMSEMAFWAYTSGWILEEFAAIVEHGWHVHMQNLWSFLNLTFIFIFSAYLILRLGSLLGAQDELARSALNILSVAAPILLHRLAFSLMPDNLLFISLRAMMHDFTVLTFLAIWCFAGFFISMKWLFELNHHNTPDDPDWPTISKWMLWIWFGLDGTGIEESVRFHTILGPALMISFAFLGNTLFLTILVAMLTNTFSKIAANAHEEIQFRRAVLTFEGVKSDAIFAYWPPFNILALVVLLPLKLLLSPRRFHTVNVAATRLLNAPLLLAISAYERYERRCPGPSPERPVSRWSVLYRWMFTGLFPHEEIHAVFDAEPPKDLHLHVAGDVLQS